MKTSVCVSVILLKKIDTYHAYGVINENINHNRLIYHNMCQTEKNVQCLRLTRRKNGFVFDVIWIYI